MKGGKKHGADAHDSEDDEVKGKKKSFHNVIRYKSRHVSILQAPVAQWIGHPPPKREIPGSSPGGSVLSLNANTNYFLFIRA